MGDGGRIAVTLIPGDGVGPEVAAAARRVLDAAGAPIDWDEQAAGAGVFRQGNPTGVPQATIDSITRTRVVLKGPLETPVGFGEKSANVTLRKLFETYANIRPVREFPGVPTPYSGRGIDLVVVRENIEDLYAGIEHQQTPDVAQCLKLISRPGCEKIVRAAFEYARAEGRSGVQRATKANIMKLTEGLLKRVFEEISPEYPEIAAGHIVVDNCAHQLVKRPEQFDVIVTTNMNGDILSDLTSALVGGLGFAPSANIGDGVAIFEAVHGSAPKYAGADTINPTALILSAALMLRHLGDGARADAVEGAVFATLAGGTRTRDVSGDAGSVGTAAFTDSVIANLGAAPTAASARSRRTPSAAPAPRSRTTHADVPRRLIGMDLFIESGASPEEIGASVEGLVEGAALRLKMISNRGTKVYPPMGAMTACVDHWRCRFVARDSEAAEVRDGDLIETIGRVGRVHRWMHVEKLQEFDGVAGYTRAQGEE